MLALVPVLAPVAVLGAGAILCLILGLFYVLYLKPLLDWLPAEGGGFFKRLVFWPVRRLQKAVRTFMQGHVATLMNAYLARISPIIRLLDNATTVTQRLAGTIGDMAEQTHRALWVLRHETVPALIAQAIAPLKAQLGRHTERLDALEDLNRGVAVVIGTGLRSLPWGVPGSLVGNFDSWWNSYRHIWTQMFEHVMPRLNQLAFVTVPELARDLNSLRARLDALTEQGLEAIRERLTRIELDWFPRVWQRLDALESGLDALAEEVFQGIGTGFAALVGRIVELERAVGELIPERLRELGDEITQLRLDIQAGIAIGVEVFGDRIETIEQTIEQTILPRLTVVEQTVQLIVQTFPPIPGVDLTAIVGRIIALEQYVFGELREQVELQRGRIERLEQQIRDDVLPRLRALEDILAPAAFAALVLATMRQVAPNLFCRNVTSTTQRICAQDEDLWAQLLAGTLVFAIALNPREVAEAGRALTGILGGVISETVAH